MCPHSGIVKERARAIVALLLIVTALSSGMAGRETEVYVRPDSGDLYADWRSRLGGQAGRHAHLWQPGLSRRQFIGTALATGAVLAVPGIVTPVAEAKTDKTLPNAITGGTVINHFALRHFYFPTIPNPAGVTSNVVSNGTGDPSTIRDFQGTVGLADFPPMGRVSGDPLGGLFWAADCRFMQGKFIDRDGHQHRGTLAFI
jgi:hypothetical protein